MQASKGLPSTVLLKNGDILFRRGYGIDSTVSMNFSQGESSKLVEISHKIIKEK